MDELKPVEPKYDGKYYCNNCWEHIDPEPELFEIKGPGKGRYFDTECDRCGLEGKEGKQQVSFVKIPRSDKVIGKAPEEDCFSDCDVSQG